MEKSSPADPYPDVPRCTVVKVLRRQLLLIKTLTSQYWDSFVPLLSASFLINATNFGFSAIVVSALPARVFASYVVGQSVVLVSAALADGGMANAAGIIASKEEPDPVLISSLRKTAAHYTIGLSIGALGSTIALSAIFAHFRQNQGVQISFLMLLVCSLIGIIQARQLLCATLIYSGGQFRPYTVVLMIPACLRLLVVVALILTIKNVTFPMLLFNDLAAATTGWACGSIWLRRLRQKLPAQPTNAGPQLGRQVHRLLRSGFTPNFLDVLGYQAVVLAGGTFASGVTTATYGVFLRVLQVVKVVLDPSLTFGTRRLRLATPSTGGRAELCFLVFIAGMYLSVAGTSFLAYVCAGQFFHHYALGHSTEFLFFLSANVLNFLYLAVDSVLLSRGYGDHRVVAAALALLSFLLFALIVRPSTLWLFVLGQAVVILPRFLYSAWVAVNRVPDRSSWDLWEPQAAEMVSPRD